MFGFKGFIHSSTIGRANDLLKQRATLRAVLDDLKIRTHDVIAWTSYDNSITLSVREVRELAEKKLKAIDATLAKIGVYE